MLSNLQYIEVSNFLVCAFQWEAVFDAFLEEAKWISSGYLPTFEEYLENGKVSFGFRAATLQPILTLDVPLPLHILQEIDFPSRFNDLASSILRLRGDMCGYKVSSHLHPSKNISSHFIDFKNGFGYEREFKISCIIILNTMWHGTVNEGREEPRRRSFVHIVLYERQSWSNRGRCSQSHQRHDRGEDQRIKLGASETRQQYSHLFQETCF